MRLIRTAHLAPRLFHPHPTHHQDHHWHPRLLLLLLLPMSRQQSAPRSKASTQSPRSRPSVVQLSSPTRPPSRPRPRLSPRPPLRSARTASRTRRAAAPSARHTTTASPGVLSRRSLGRLPIACRRDSTPGGTEAARSCIIRGMARGVVPVG